MAQPDDSDTRLLSLARRMAHALDYANVYLPHEDREPGDHPRWPHPLFRPVLSREDARSLADEFYVAFPDAESTEES